MTCGAYTDSKINMYIVQEQKSVITTFLNFTPASLRFDAFGLVATWIFQVDWLW